jgi:hypothetical protein
MSYIIIDQAPANEGEFKLGLEEEGMNVYPTGSNTLEIPMRNSKWLHGLTPEELIIVEQHYGHSFSKPEHNEFWSNISFEVKNYLQSVDIERPDNILMVSILKQSGMCAESMDEVEDKRMHQFIYVIKRKDEDDQKKLSLYERQDEAIVQLNRVKKSSNKYMLALAFQATPNPFELGSNYDIAYTRLRELIDGKFTDNKYEGIDRFNAALQLPKEKLYATVDVNLAIRKNIIRRNGKMHYYNPLSNVEYGKTVDSIVDYLLDPTNQEEYGVSKDAPPYSIKKQLERYT